MAAAMGTVMSLWRYPVKSMGGEEPQAAELAEYGFLGDRAYALIDDADGKVATAKNPGKWPTLLGFRASFVNHPQRAAPRCRWSGKEVRLKITGPCGRCVMTTLAQGDLPKG